MSFLILRDIEKKYVVDKPVLRGFNLNVAAGEIVCLLGSSGCGKTTLLRLLAGLEVVDGGELRLDGTDIRKQAPHRRRIGFMFQDHVLFPHMNVGTNIAYGLHMQGWSRDVISARVEELLKMVRLPGYAKRGIHELSGGEGQRVALARGLAPNPRLMLLDEPLASLDRKLREELVQEVKELLQEMSMTALYVTHDHEEAYAIADRIALMHGGKVIREDTPQELYRDPGSAYAARFLRMGNLFPCLGSDFGLLPSWLKQNLDFKGTEAHVLIRSDSLLASPLQGNQRKIEVPIRVGSMTFRGRYYEMQLDAFDFYTPNRSWPLTLDLAATDASPLFLAKMEAKGPEAEILTIYLDVSRIQLLEK